MNPYLWFAIFCLLVTAIAALAYAHERLRAAALGDELLDACGGDWDSARLAVANVRAENAVMRAAARRAFSAADLRVINGSKR